MILAYMLFPLQENRMVDFNSVRAKVPAICHGSLFALNAQEIFPPGYAKSVALCLLNFPTAIFGGSTALNGSVAAPSQTIKQLWIANHHDR